MYIHLRPLNNMKNPELTTVWMRGPNLPSVYSSIPLTNLPEPPFALLTCFIRCMYVLNENSKQALLSYWRFRNGYLCPIWFWWFFNGTALVCIYINANEWGICVFECLNIWTCGQYVNVCVCSCVWFIYRKKILFVVCAERGKMNGNIEIARHKSAWLAEKVATTTATTIKSISIKYQILSIYMQNAFTEF